MSPKIRNILILVLLIAIVVVVHIVRRNAVIRGLECHVEKAGAELLTPPEVDSLIHIGFPRINATQIKDIDEDAMEKHLEKHPYIRHAEVNVTNGGKVIVEVVPQAPVVRMFYQGNEFYISREGTCMPLCPNHYCNVLVGSSDWEEPLLKRPSTLNLADTSRQQPISLKKIWRLASFLFDHPKYGDVFDQVYLDDKGDLYLVPKLSNLYILVGDTTELETKFENLWAFFDQGINQVGWDAYSSISLKYKGQVVCTWAEKQ